MLGKGCEGLWGRVGEGLAFYASIRKGRTWAIAVRGGWYTSLFLPNSGRFPRENS